MGWFSVNTLVRAKPHSTRISVQKPPKRCVRFFLGTLCWFPLDFLPKRSLVSVPCLSSSFFWGGAPLKVMVFLFSFHVETTQAWVPTPKNDTLLGHIGHSDAGARRKARKRRPRLSGIAWRPQGSAVEISRRSSKGSFRFHSEPRDPSF